MRIVSLISSATEILCQLGLKDQLVGISHECDYPEEIKGLPICSEPLINPNQRGINIDKEVRELVRKGLSIYQVKTEMLEKLKPDLIVTQDQCEVCAVSLKDVEAAVCKLTQSSTKICTLHPYTLDDIHRDFRRIGEATGKIAEAEKLVTAFWIKLNQVNARAGTSGQYRPKILCLEWLEPLIVAGSWIPELVTLAGSDALIVSEEGPFKTVKWEEIEAQNPDAIIIMPCGYGIEKTMSELKISGIDLKLNSLPVGKKGRVFVADGNAYFNRPGPRIAETCEIIASIAKPDVFKDFVELYLGKAYVPL